MPDFDSLPCKGSRVDHQAIASSKQSRHCGNRKDSGQLMAKVNLKISDTRIRCEDRQIAFKMSWVPWNHLLALCQRRRDHCRIWKDDNWSTQHLSWCGRRLGQLDSSCLWRTLSTLQNTKTQLSTTMPQKAIRITIYFQLMRISSSMVKQTATPSTKPVRKNCTRTRSDLDCKMTDLGIIRMYSQLKNPNLAENDAPVETSTHY